METKNCQFCGEEIRSDAMKCKHCHEWVADKKELTYVRKFSGRTSTTKFVTLYFATLGIYPLFWMYDQWKYLKEKQHLKISPFWRAFFGTLWAGALAGDVEKLLNEENIKVTYSAALIGISFFILNILYKLPDPYWLIALFSFIPLLPILDAMNQYYSKSESNLPEAELAWWQVVLTGLGLVFFTYVAYLAFYPN